MSDTRPASDPGRSLSLRRNARDAGALGPLLEIYHRMYPRAKTALIERAHAVAEQAHEGQLRKSGEAYISHPIAVAEIIAGLGLPDTVIAAALLHDVVEDTNFPLEEIQAEFGDEVASFVDGVTKLDRLTFGDAAEAETVRKLVVAMARDMRVVLLKLADRLHNARTWDHVAPATARRKAQETLEIYAPLAHRMGLNAIKWELEDLSFRTLYPKIYQEIVEVVAERSPEREKHLDEVRKTIAAQLKDKKIKAEITGRPKHYYSVYQKMIVRGRDLNEIYDLVGIRILVETRARLLRGPRRDALHVPAGSRQVQGLHRDAQVQPLPVAPHDGDRAPGQAHRAADPHVGHAQARRIRLRGALALQGEREGREGACRRRTTPAGCARSPTGSRRRPTRPSSSTRCAARSRAPRCTCSRHAASSSRCRKARPPSTSPTRCTPTSATRRWAPRSTVASSRSTRPSTTATPSRSSPRRTRMRTPSATGSSSCSRRGRATRSGSGSRASDARSRSRPAATCLPGRFAASTCRCSA